MEGQSGDEQRHREADTSDRSDTHHMPPSDTLGQPTNAQPDCNPTEAGDADELADDERNGNAAHHRRRGRDRVSREHNASVSEREDRHDEIVRPRVQSVDQPIARRDRPSDQNRRRTDIAGPDVVVVLEDIDQFFGLRLGLIRMRRREETHDDAGDGGMDS